MKWRTIVELYTGVIGKSLVVISLATPMAFIMNFGINIEKYHLSLTGAMVIALAYVLSTLNTPAIIKSHPTEYDYADRISAIHKEEGLDQVLEFKCLENNISCLKNGFNRDQCYISKFESITKFIEDFGPERGVRNMAIIKYNYINESRFIIRSFLTSTFAIGIVLLYYPLATSIYKIIIGGTR